MITNVIAEPQAKIEAKIGSNGFERTFETALEPFQVKVESLSFIEQQNYPAQKRLICVSNSKKYKVSQWEETSVGAEMWVHSMKFTIKVDGSDKERYYLRATHTQEPPIS